MKLGELERKVMDYIWETRPSDTFSVRDIVEGMHTQPTNGKLYAYNTILTVITHLYKKKLLNRQTLGKTFTYNARLSKAAFVEQASRAVFEQMRKEYGNLAIAHFAHIVEDIDPALIAAAQEEIDTHTA